LKKMTLLAVLLGIYFLYNLAVLGVWAGSVPSDPPFLALVMGPILWVVAIVTTGVTTWAAYRFLPKESAQTGPAAAADGGANVTVGRSLGRKIVWVTSREAGIIAAFSGITFAWNALGLIIVVFPPGSWSITGIMPQIVGMGTGPIGLFIAHFLGGLLWYDFPWGTFNFMLSSTFLVTIAYYFYHDVVWRWKYPILFAQTFLLHQYDVFTWALWASNFAKLAPVDFVVPSTLVFIGPWTLLNTVPLVIIVALLDKYAPGFLRPTWLDRYTTK
jgi:hypothetical protein